MRKKSFFYHIVYDGLVTSNLGHFCQYFLLYILTLEARKAFTKLHSYIMSELKKQNKTKHTVYLIAYQK